MLKAFTHNFMTTITFSNGLKGVDYFSRRDLKVVTRSSISSRAKSEFLDYKTIGLHTCNTFRYKLQPNKNYITVFKCSSKLTFKKYFFLILRWIPHLLEEWWQLSKVVKYANGYQLADQYCTEACIPRNVCMHVRMKVSKCVRAAKRRV